eukprot:m.25671 g.25671  ORF g.25671 m.25671 type:complete len:524 (+) comp7729_c0_seq1:307-1878(+)
MEYTADEKAIYGALWKKEASQTGVVDAGDAVELLRLSTLDDDILFKVWELSDPDEKGHLEEDMFFRALKLIAVAQAGLEVSLSNLPKATKIADLGKATKDLSYLIKPAAAAVQSSTPGAAASAPVGDDVWAIAPEDQARFNNVFKSLGPDANGILGGKRARQVLTKSKLPTAALCRIWEVSDIDQDGGLSLHEFSVAMNLVAKCLEGREPPEVLPDCLLPQGSKASSTPAAPPAKTPPAVASKPKPAPAAEPSVAPSGDIKWAVSDGDKATYDRFFKSADKDGDGLVDGGGVMKIFVRSKLDKPTLAFIWELVDINKSGQINAEQFALAMHLISIKVKGGTLPDTLTPELIPPSFRGSMPETAPTLPASQPDPTPAPIPQQPAKEPSVNEDADSDVELEEQRRANEALKAQIAAQQAEIDNQGKELSGVQSDIRQLKKEEIELRKRLKAGKDELNQIMTKVREAKNERQRLQANLADRRTKVERTESSLAAQREKHAGLLQSNGAPEATETMGGMSFGDYFGG